MGMPQGHSTITELAVTNLDSTSNTISGKASAGRGSDCRSHEYIGRDGALLPLNGNEIYNMEYIPDGFILSAKISGHIAVADPDGNWIISLVLARSQV